MNGSSMRDGGSARPPPQDELERLFDEVRALAPPFREAYLQTALPADAEVRQEVLSLLEHAEAAEAFFGRLQQHTLSTWSSDGEDVGDPTEAATRAARDLPPGTRVGRYRIVETIGAGGMGVVYRAHDEALDRDVALKLLPPCLALDPAARERFLREARAAAALDHPHICTVHEVGEDEAGRLFLAMAYYEGETLKARLARGPLPLEEVTAAAIQLARGLAAAHARGIVHRDVKPANVMAAADGAVKLLDFGLARVADDPVTRPGLTPGTVAYMSPEQVRGDRVDHRTDLWALGVVLYEMLAGVRPFRGGSDRIVLDAIVHKEPEAVRALRPETPEPMAHVIERLLKKNPEERYGSARELLLDLETAARGDRIPKQPAWAPATHRRPSRVLRSRPLTLLLLAGLLPVLGWSWMTRPPSPALHPHRVVAAPFENRTGDPALDPIGIMAADWITEGISQIATANVVPTSAALVSAYRVRDSLAVGMPADPIRALGEETGAGLVISGTYYGTGDSLQFHVQITDTRQQRVLRSLEPVDGILDAPMGSIEQLRQRVLAALAPFLDTRLAGSPPHFHGHPPGYEAYSAYAEGLETYLRGRWRESIEHLERAVALDSDYLAPLWLLGSAYGHLGDIAMNESTAWLLNRSRERLTPFQRAGLDIRLANLRGDRIAAYETARRAAVIAPQSLLHVHVGVEAVRLNRPREAIQVLSGIDPTRGVVRSWPVYWGTLTEAHHVLGNHRRELREARRARALSPDEPRYLVYEARALAALGRLAEMEALVEAEGLLLEQGGQTGTVMRVVGDELRIHGRADAARQWYDRAISWHVRRPAREQVLHRTAVGTMLIAAGRWHEAQEAFRALAAEDPESLKVQGSLGIVAARLGDEAEAERVLAWLSGLEPPRPAGAHSFQRACIAAQLGRDPDAVALLLEALSRGYEHGWGLHHTACLDPLRGLPGFRDLMRARG